MLSQWVLGGGASKAGLLGGKEKESRVLKKPFSKDLEKPRAPPSKLIRGWAGGKVHEEVFSMGK